MCFYTFLKNKRFDIKYIHRCAVCLEDFGKNKIVAFTCGHIVCLKCYLLNKFNKCHICRGNVSSTIPFIIKKQKIECVNCNFSDVNFFFVFH